VLEVDADNIKLHWNMRATVGSCSTLRAGFSRVVIQGARLRVVCFWPRGVEYPPADGPSAAEALASVVRYGPPTLRSFSLTSRSRPENTGQTWDLKLLAEYHPDQQVFNYDTEQFYWLRHQDTLSCRPADKFAEELQPFAQGCGIELQVDEQNQVVHLTRTDTA